MTTAPRPTRLRVTLELDVSHDGRAPSPERLAEYVAALREDIQRRADHVADNAAVEASLVAWNAETVDGGAR